MKYYKDADGYIWKFSDDYTSYAVYYNTSNSWGSLSAYNSTYFNEDYKTYSFKNLTEDELFTEML